MINLFKYLFKKRSEIQDLDFSDALLAQANLRIYRTRTHKTKDMVPLKCLKFIHSLNRENARNVLKQRVGVLNEFKSEILVNKEIKMDKIFEYLPSISAIKVIEVNHWNYFVFEGNSRVAALKEIYGDSEEIRIEVEQYHFKSKKSIIRMLNRLRILNKLA